MPEPNLSFSTEPTTWIKMLNHFGFGTGSWPFELETGWKKTLHKWLDENGGNEMDHKCVSEW